MVLPPLIWEEFHAEEALPAEMDWLWAHGWRHFGARFFRYSVTWTEDEIEIVLPLRVDLDAFVPSRSQRRVLRRNADLEVRFEPAGISEEVRAIFGRHRERFTTNVPPSIEVFLDAQDPSRIPCPCMEQRCYDDGRLVAASFFDLGAESVSSVCAVFEPGAARRSLGIFTLLGEFAWAREHGRRYAYPGYATHGPSHYDYKKQFAGLQGFDWATEEWRPMPR